MRVMKRAGDVIRKQGSSWCGASPTARLPRGGLWRTRQPKRQEPMPTNVKPPRTWELLQRERKALRLADTLNHYHVTATEAEQASEADWVLAAQVAGVNPPSKATIDIVIQMLKSRETPQDAA